MRRALIVAGVVICTVAGLGCTSDPSGEAVPVTTTTTAAAAPTEWIAVYEVSPYSDAVQREFIEAAGSHVFEGPVRCFTGLAERPGIDDDATILALVASSEEAVRAAAEKMDGTPELVSAFPSNCRD